MPSPACRIASIARGVGRSRVVAARPRLLEPKADVETDRRGRCRRQSSGRALCAFGEQRLRDAHRQRSADARVRGPARRRRAYARSIPCLARSAEQAKPAISPPRSATIRRSSRSRARMTSGEASAYRETTSRSMRSNSVCSRRRDHRGNARRAAPRAVGSFAERASENSEPIAVRTRTRAVSTPARRPGVRARTSAGGERRWSAAHVATGAAASRTSPGSGRRMPVRSSNP